MGGIDDAVNEIFKRDSEQEALVEAIIIGQYGSVEEIDWDTVDSETFKRDVLTPWLHFLMTIQVEYDLVQLMIKGLSVPTGMPPARPDFGTMLHPSLSQERLRQAMERRRANDLNQALDPDEEL